MFVLVFFIAEPTSTPETDEMMAIYPFLTALLTIWFRIQFGIIEAALYAVVFAQFFIWVFEQFQNRTYPNRVKTLYGLTGVIWVVIITFLFIF